jgi:hypothetical protein
MPAAAGASAKATYPTVSARPIKLYITPKANFIATAD